MFFFENFLFCPLLHLPVYQTQGVQCVFLKHSEGMGAALEHRRPTSSRQRPASFPLCTHLSAPIAGGCLAWACTSAVSVVTVAVCVTAQLCTENTVSYLRLYTLSVPSFMNIPEPFGKGGDMHFLFRAQHFTASYSCTLTGAAPMLVIVPARQALIYGYTSKPFL